MRFSVLTATFNRAHTLQRLFQSLCYQSFRDFEWVIVDDGSTDGTKDLINSWATGFPIRYAYQENLGKPAAINRGVQMCSGDLIMTVDSDDALVPETLSILDNGWREIGDERFICLNGLCYQADGKSILGPGLNRRHIDTFSFEETQELPPYDFAGVIRADVLKRFPFPVFKGEKYIPEGIVWQKILDRYAARFLNVPILVKNYIPEGLTSQGRKVMWESPRGHALYFRQLAASKIPLKRRARAMAAATVLRAASMFK